jgi:hypothetical protein
MPRNKSLNVYVSCVKTKKHASHKFISKIAGYSAKGRVTSKIGGRGRK